MAIPKSPARAAPALLAGTDLAHMGDIGRCELVQGRLVRIGQAHFLQAKCGPASRIPGPGKPDQYKTRALLSTFPPSPPLLLLLPREAPLRRISSCVTPSQSLLRRLLQHK